MSSSRLRLQQYAQHAAQRLGGAPQQLVTNGEGAQVFRPHCQFAQATDRDAHGAGDGHRRQVLHRGFAGIRHHAHPFIVLGNHGFDVG